MIAISGRVGSAKVLVTNQEICDIFGMSGIPFKVLVDERVKDVILYRMNTHQQPGLFLLHNDNKYEFVINGLHPEYQFEKIKIED